MYESVLINADLGTNGGASPSSQPSPSPSEDAIAGIVIGAIVGLLIILSGILVWLRKRRRNERIAEAGNMHRAPSDATWGEAELDSHQIQPTESKAEREIKEVHAPDAPPVELPGHAVIPEGRDVSSLNGWQLRLVSRVASCVWCRDYRFGLDCVFDSSACQ